MVIREKIAYFDTMMQIPPYLSPGDKIGLAAPARWVDEDDIRFFTEHLEEQGYQVRTGSVHRRFHQFSGTDEERVNDFQSLLDDPEIRAVICVRGGYGSARILERIDFNAFAMNPKWIAGFSDVTALHSCILMKMGTAVLHSGMPYTFREGKDEDGLKSLMNALRGNFSAYEVQADKMNRTGRAEGILLGGNLSVLYSLTGTSYQIPTRGAILFLEDVDEYLYHIDRMMLNLSLAGMLEHLSGLVIGGMTDMHDNDTPFGKNAYEIVMEAVDAYDFPVSFGFPAGHQEPNLAMILGREVHLEVNSDGSIMEYLQARK